MAAIYNDAVVTVRGVDLINAAIAQEKPIVFTKVATGDGHWNSYIDLTTATSLINEKNSYTIVSKVANGNQYKLKALISNYNPDTGESVIPASYNINEVGIFAKLGLDGTEILYAIITAETTGDIINAYDGTNPVQIVFSYVTTISTDANVILKLTGAYALAEDLESTQESLSQAQSEIDTLSTSQSELASTVSNHSTSLSELASSASETKSEVASLSTSQSELAKTVESQSESLSRLSTSESELASEVTSFKSKVAATYQTQHKKNTVTLAVADWNTSTLQQQVSASNVKASNTIIVSPDPTTYDVYCAAGVRATAQAAGKVTFKCDGIPETDVKANIVILN